MSSQRNNRRTASYRNLLSNLPAEVQKLAEEAFLRFCDAPESAALRVHKLKSDGRGKHRPNSISVSVNRQYRAIYVEDGDTNVWYWIGTHAAYDTFIGT